MQGGDKRGGPKKEGFFEELTRRPRAPDAMDEKNTVPFEEWNWEKHDPEFFRMFQKYPEAQNPQTTHQVRWNRYNLAKQGGVPKYDFRPRNFAWVMRKEIALFCTGITLGFVFLPWWWNGVIRAARNDPNSTFTKNGQQPLRTPEPQQ